MTNSNEQPYLSAGQNPSFGGGGFLLKGYILKVAVLTAAYVLTGGLGLLVAIPPGYATAIWPPSGIALAALLGWGPRLWPGVWLGAFLVNIWIAFQAPNAKISFTSLAVAASISIGSTLQALLGAYLLQRWIGAGRLFERGTNILAFAAIEALCCVVASTWGVTILSLAGVGDWSAFFGEWRTWWLCDLTGILIVTPALLTWRELPLTDRRPWQLVETIGSLALLAAITIFIFVGSSSSGAGEYPRAFLALPCLVWVAFRFAPGGVALATLLLSGLAVCATSFGFGPFVRAVNSESVLLLQSYTGLVTLMGLTLAAAVTGHKQAEISLREQEEKYHDLYDNAPDMFVSVDAATATIKECNQTLSTALGYTKQEMLGRPIFDLYHPDCLQEVRKAFQAFQATGEVHDTELQLQCKNGAKIDVSLNVSAFRDKQGRILYSRSVWRDITERKRAEEQFRASEERFALAVRGSNDGIWDWDIVSNSDFFSERWCELLGYEARELQQEFETWASRLHPDERDGVLEHLRRHLEERAPYDIESRLRTKSGAYRWFRARGQAIWDESGKPVRMAGSISDIHDRKLGEEQIRRLNAELEERVRDRTAELATANELLRGEIQERMRAEEERRGLEAQIQHAQKLESLGVLAGGIAHDFNNLLTGILGYADLAQLSLPLGSLPWNYINEVVKGARQAAELTQQMLAYSGKGRFVVQPLNISALVEDMGRLLEISISKKCVLQYHFMPDLPACEADTAQMRQIIMNLVINASEAIGDRSGVIAVSTGVMHCDRAYLSETYLDENLPDGLYVYLEVADTGCGMSEETRAKVFDPFFTTKFTGRGLGLAAVLGIARGHHGAIKVYSEPDRGTSFKVLFPAKTSVASLEPAQQEETALWRGSGTVLIVDDEESVRGLARAMMETMGFSVLTAADGREGVDVFRRESERIRLVILDMTMPHLDGEQTFREMRRIRNGVPTILSSGYNEQTATNRFAGKGLAAFIQKPYQYKQLVEVARQALAEKDEPNPSP